MKSAVDVQEPFDAALPGSAARGREGNRLLLLSEHFYPTEATCGRLLTALSEDLVAQGLEVSVLTSFSVHSASRSKSRRETYRGVDICRVRSLRLPRSRVLCRLLNEMSLTLTIFLNALLRPGLERIMVTSSPPFLAPAAALVAAIRRVPLIYLVMDVYPDIAAVTGHLERGSLLYRTWDAVCRFALKRSTRVVVLGECMRNVIRAKTAGEEVAIEVVPNWADGEEIFPIADDENRFFASHPGLEGRFLVQYSGNFGLFHDFETIIDAAEALKDREEIHFLIIGKGARKRWIEEQIAGRGLNNVTLLPYMPRSELNFSLNAQSVSLVTLERGTEGLSVPSKFYPLLAAGKPVIAVMNQAAEVARVVENEGVGVVVEQQDVEGLVAAIERLSESPRLCALMGQRAREVQQRRFDRRHAVRRYMRLIRSVSPADRSVSPADRSVSAADRSVSPAGRSVSPADRSVSPADRFLLPAERSLLPADRSLSGPETGRLRPTGHLRPERG
ncbi:MAG TPA: glycosyltransferase family 4 protein [Trueperaceae bacterium]